MATDEATSEFGKPDVALRMNGATVKVIMGFAVWTGTIIGSKDGKTLILTVAHPVFESGNWMTLSKIEQVVVIQFYGTVDLLPCRVARLDQKADILLLIVDRDTPEDHKMKFAPQEECELVESQLLGARGHQGKHQWTLADGQVCTPRLVNGEFHNVFPEYSGELSFCVHKLDLEKGCSGAALVNLNGNMVGMQMGMPGDEIEVVAAKNMSGAVKAKIKQLENEFSVKKDVLDPSALEIASKKLHSEIRNAKVGLASLHYGSNDYVTIPVTLSQIKYAIRVEFIKKMIQGNDNRSLEDIYISTPFAAGSSTARFY